MSTLAAPSNSYDELPYPSQPLPQSDPDRLASLAKLFAFEAAPANQCRVLELGCANGGNLIPMADRFPRSRYLGVDYSLRQVNEGRAIADQLGLENLKFVHANIAELDASIGEFDYIICHGVFSWVARPIQDQILQFARQRLSRNGLLYLSYNVYPGWHRRAIIRELAATTGNSDAPPAARAERTAQVLRTISSALSKDESPYARQLHGEIDVLLNQTRTYLFHEFLEEDNHPLYFYEFAERLGQFGLQYLGEATPTMMFATNFGPELSQLLLQMSTDVISLEQHMDVLRNRAFRQSVICRGDAQLARYITPAQLAGIYVSSRLRPANENPDLKSDKVETFFVGGASNVARGAGRISSPSPAFKAAMFLMGKIWPRRIRYEQLVQDISTHLAGLGRPLSAVDVENLGHNVIQCIASGIIDLANQPDDFVGQVSERPCASRLARWQALSGPNVTNRRHQTIALDQLGQQLMQHLDGDHRREELLEALSAGVDRGEVSIFVNEIPATRGKDVLPLLENSLDECLARMAEQALLVG